jgi:excisionase family DNA binding protein
MGKTRLRTVRQVADELGLATVTIRTWMAQRRLPYIRLGRSVRIPEAGIQHLIERGTVPSLERGDRR